MGLLDDAIREHLDLKRAHGASDDEIAQKEAEALGPARREFPRAVEEEERQLDDAPAQVAEEPLDERFHTFGDPLSEEIAEPPVFDPSPAPEAAAEPAPPPAPAPLADTEEYRFEDDEDDDLESDDEDDDLDDDDDVSELDEDEDDEDEDLLEDTPEFLQDTPEHDRLWFEQKPPRDFDFE